MPSRPLAGLRMPVFVESWQIECCGTPPALGDQVEWSLLLVDRQPGTVPDPAADVTLDAVATRLAVPIAPDPEFSGPDEPAWTYVTLLTTAGLQAYWPVAPVAPVADGAPDAAGAPHAAYWPDAADAADASDAPDASDAADWLGAPDAVDVGGAGGVTGPVRARGLLLEDHHGGTPPGTLRTRGTIARVRIATVHYVLEPGSERTYVFGPGATRYRDVGRSPAYFGSSPTEDGPEYWEEAGVLVDLVVQDRPATDRRRS